MDSAAETSRSSGTKQRLLEAAGRMFAARGLEGATTREIAQEAGVNEVTLFRLFQSKEKLQAAVLEHVFDQQAELLAAQPAGPARELRPELCRLTRIYSALLNQNLPLIRMLLGEIHRHGEYEERVLRGIFAPLRAELVSTIDAARSAGSVRPDTQPALAADALIGMIFTGVLKRGSPFAPKEYTHEQYLAASLDTFLNGIEKPV